MYARKTRVIPSWFAWARSNPRIVGTPIHITPGFPGAGLYLKVACWLPHSRLVSEPSPLPADFHRLVSRATVVGQTLPQSVQAITYATWTSRDSWHLRGRTMKSPSRIGAWLRITHLETAYLLTFLPSNGRYTICCTHKFPLGRGSQSFRAFPQFESVELQRETHFLFDIGKSQG